MTENNWCSIQGMQKIKEEVMKIKFHKLSYTIFTVSQIDPVGFSIDKSEGFKISNDPRAVKSKEDLISIFEKCKNNLDLNSSAFIVYDFGYYNDCNNYREMVVLIYYISDSTEIKKRIIMASNVQEISNILEVGTLIKIQDPEDFTYEKIRQTCASIQRK